MRGACPPLTWWPSAEDAANPGEGGLSPHNVRLLKAAELRLKMLGSDAGGSATGGGGAALLGGLRGGVGLGWVKASPGRPDPPRASFPAPRDWVGRLPAVRSQGLPDC